MESFDWFNKEFCSVDLDMQTFMCLRKEPFIFEECSKHMFMVLIIFKNLMSNFSDYFEWSIKKKLLKDRKKIIYL